MRVSWLQLTLLEAHTVQLGEARVSAEDGVEDCCADSLVKRDEKEVEDVVRKLGQ